MRPSTMISMCVCLAMVTFAEGQGFVSGDISIVSDGDSLRLVIPGFKAVKGKNSRTNTVIFRPVITDGEYRWILDPIVCRSGKQRAAALRKNGDAPHPGYAGASFVRPGKSLDYSVRFPGQGWMEGADLLMETFSVGCCTSTGPETHTITRNIKTLPLNEGPVGTEEESVFSQPVTVGKLLSLQYPFIKPSADGREGAHVIYDDEREQYMSIYFRQGRSTIEDAYMDNDASLELLEGVVGTLMDSEDSGITVISVVGFASPEGTFEMNDRLAWSRGVAVKNRMISIGIPADIIKVNNGSEEWRGLRMMVENSEMEDKDLVLDILLNVPMKDEAGNTTRLQQLQKLKGGKPYKYMLDNFFPYLRNAAYIRVYYDEQL